MRIVDKDTQALVKLASAPESGSNARLEGETAACPHRTLAQEPPSLRLVSPGEEVQEGVDPGEIIRIKTVASLVKSIRKLYGALDACVEQASRPPAQVGFRAAPVEPVRVEPLAAECVRTVKTLNTVIDRPATDEFLVHVQSMAKEVKLMVQRMRLFLMHPEFQQGVNEVLLPVVADQCAQFVRALGDPMNDLVSLMHGITVQRNPASA